MAVGAALAYLGWTLPTVGTSLAIPALIVFGAGIAIAGGTWVVACFLFRRTELWVFAVTVGVLTVTATGWTLEFALPAKMAWDSGANQEVQALIAKQGATSNAHGIAPPHCSTVFSRGIGPLPAPYVECGTWNNQAHAISFSPDSRTEGGGVQYTNVGARIFEDQCYRHLVGEWWAFAPQTDGMGGCPFGYHFEGGG